MTAALDPLHVPLRGSRLIEASAGTGKTFTIAALYLRLVLGHGDDATRFAAPLAPPSILVMTFTIAATRELSERIRRRLVEAAQCFRDDGVPAGDPFLRDLLAEYSEPAAREEAAWRLASAAEGMDDAAIHTIDAWIQRMLREHAFDSGSLFDEELQPDDHALRAEAARDYWRQEVYPLSTALFQRTTALWATPDALEKDVRPMLRELSSTTDDARSLTTAWAEADGSRLAALARLKADWIAQDGTQVMRTWIAAQLARANGPLEKGKFRQSNIDSWLGALDAWANDRLAIEPDMSATARARFTPDGIRDASSGPVDIPPIFDAFEAMLDATKRPHDAHAIRRHAARRIAARVRRQKEAASQFGFDDLLARLDAALAGPGGERLRDRIVAQYPVALIDEFQDTSPLQYRIFDRLYRIVDDDPATALFLIGDPKQSIYSFRGADIDSYLRARRAMAGRHHPLTRNFRSTHDVVAGVNRIFTIAEDRPGDGAFRYREADGDDPVPFVPVVAQGRAEIYRDAAGPVAALTLWHDPELRRKEDAQPRFAALAAAEIATALGDPARGFESASSGFVRLRPADIAVLVRDRHEAEAMRRALQRHRIASVYLSAQDSVFATAEAADLLLWLRAVAEPLDARRVRLALAADWIGLSFEELAVLAVDDRRFEVRVETMRELHACWRDQGVLPMLRRTLHTFDLPARWLRRGDDEADGDGDRRLTNVLHLAELLQTASTHLEGEEALIRWLADEVRDGGEQNDEQVLRLESDANLVQIVTIHKSKGLEYPIVYLPFATGVRETRPKKGDVDVVVDAAGERELVLDLSGEAGRRLMRNRAREDLRLLYVALTRARHALWIGVPSMRFGTDPACTFHRSAFGYLISGDDAVHESRIDGLLRAAFRDLPSVAIHVLDADSHATRPLLAVAPRDATRPLIDPPHYDASFERDWSIASFSSLVRTLPRATIVQPVLDPAIEEELRASADEADEWLVPSTPAPASGAARHRFPRGAAVGNFLHEHLEWLAEHRFALATDEALQEQLRRRCERQGWGHRARDLIEWMSEVVDTPLPPLGASLDALDRVLPEMEFWFPSEGLAARRIDALCREQFLPGHARAALPDRTLRGMLMGFADLVVEHDGRYWVVDYKSNVLGTRDEDYHRDALAAAMLEHRYDVQAAIYLLALHRLLKHRLGDAYRPDRQLGGALYLFLRGVHGPEAGCHVAHASGAWLDGFDAALGMSEAHTA